MATRETRPIQNFDYPTETVASYSTRLSRIKNNIVTGKIITFSDMNDLMFLLNSWRVHYHRYNDIYQQATFGNTGNRNTLSQDINTLFPVNVDIGLGGPSGLIESFYRNYMAGMANQLRTHVHTINDRIAA